MKKSDTSRKKGRIEKEGANARNDGCLGMDQVLAWEGQEKSIQSTPAQHKCGLSGVSLGGTWTHIRKMTSEWVHEDHMGDRTAIEEQTHTQSLSLTYCMLKVIHEKFDELLVQTW